MEAFFAHPLPINQHPTPSKADVEEQLGVLSAEVRSVIRDVQYADSFQRIAILRLVQAIPHQVLQTLTLRRSIGDIRAETKG